MIFERVDLSADFDSRIALVQIENAFIVTVFIVCVIVLIVLYTDGEYLLIHKF